MKNPIFYTNTYQKIELKVKNLLNSYEDFLSTSTARSTRAVGDAVESIITENFEEILGNLSSKYSAEFARRAMADLAFKSVDNYYHVIDVKTHRTDTKFNMPNLTSVERLSRFYEDDTNYFVLLLISYHLDNISLNVTDVLFVPIEFLGWDCLTVGALGWGQIQIANSNRITINPQYPRKKWMLELCDVLMEFYPREIAKINERIERFEKVREFWLAKPDE